jgi:hypothetical protein
MKWEMNSDDVSFGYSGSSSGGTFERKTKITSRRLWMLHKPTKIKVEKEIPPGHYSKKEMQKLTNEGIHQLTKELEQKVAKHLKIPGR